MKIRQAECKRVMERQDQLCADVEVTLEGEDKQLVVLFAETGEQDYEIVMVLRKDAAAEIDWYDNDLHAAYEDVTESLFTDEQGEMNRTSREAFRKEVLSYDGVREAIRSRLEEARREKVEA